MVTLVNNLHVLLFLGGKVWMEYFYCFRTLYCCHNSINLCCLATNLYASVQLALKLPTKAINDSPYNMADQRCLMYICAPQNMPLV